MRHGVWCLLQSERSAALRQHWSRFPLLTLPQTLQRHPAFRYGRGGCQEEQTGELKLLSTSGGKRLLMGSTSSEDNGNKMLEEETVWWGALAWGGFSKAVVWILACHFQIYDGNSRSGDLQSSNSQQKRLQSIEEEARSHQISRTHLDRASANGSWRKNWTTHNNEHMSQISYTNRKIWAFILFVDVKLNSLLF